MRKVFIPLLAAAVVTAVMFAVLLFFRVYFGVGLPETESVEEKAIAAKALTDDECAALRWLDYVTGTLDEAEEKAWWDIGARQFGLFAKRYNIAFAGYAAAALGMRGDDDQRKTAGRIFGNCIGRMLRRDVWAYTQHEKYWGTKPWAPDPCFRENVMYTGHLLQLLAFYELFTGDKRYWTEGFDFVWSDGRRIHYDTGKLIGVTVEQMRENRSGGVTCEPGMMFFPCNNHPHIALRVFSRLGHGDWISEARRWEKWALRRFFRPIFGGGAMNMIYYRDRGAFYPRGSIGLDAWSIIWYEPWAADRRNAFAVWTEVKKALDEERLSCPSDEYCSEGTCCEPLKIPSSVEAVFLAAAARTCDDAPTASRLESVIDAKFLSRKDGFFMLDMDREWRIGATAHRIIALALSNGSSFRAMLRSDKKLSR